MHVILVTLFFFLSLYYTMNKLLKVDSGSVHAANMAIVYSICLCVCAHALYVWMVVLIFHCTHLMKWPIAPWWPILYFEFLKMGCYNSAGYAVSYLIERCPIFFICEQIYRITVNIFFKKSPHTKCISHRLFQKLNMAFWHPAICSIYIC